MRKVKFLSGLNTKLALAAALVAGFTFTGCTEENLSVTTDSDSKSSTATLTVEGQDVEDGVVYLNLTATNTQGVELKDVTFTNESTGKTPATTYSQLEEEYQFEVIASKEGFLDSQKTVTIPVVSAGTYVILNVNIVLTTIDEQTVYVTETESGSEDSAADEDNAVTETKTVDIAEGETETITYTSVSGVPFMTEDQKDALYTAIDAAYSTASANTRAASIETRVNDILTAYVEGYNEEVGESTYSFDVTSTSGVVTEVEYTATPYYVKMPITITALVDGEEYSVEGTYTVYTKIWVETYTSGYYYHSHDHSTHYYTHVSHSSHGYDTNAGGGTAGE